MREPWEPVAPGAGDLLLEQPLATCLPQPLTLAIQGLVVGGDTRVAPMLFT
jgi:hypothetical protein